MVEGSRKDRYSKRKLKFYRLKTAFLLLSAFALLIAIIFSSYLVYLAYTIDDIGLHGYIYPSAVFSSTDTALGIIGAGPADFVPIDEMSPYFVNAVIAVEDNSFYSHRGVNPAGIGRAMYVNIRNRRIVQGGSTITQQLAKNIFLTHERTLDRKLRELVYTFKLERNYTKDEILEAYLNNIYYGHGNYGVHAASNYYFGKHPSDLTLDESALLAGIIQGPYLYTPFRTQNVEARDIVDDSKIAIADDITQLDSSIIIHPTSRTYTRRSFVLNRMVQQDFITSEEAEDARDKPFPVREPGEEITGALQVPQLVSRELDRIEQLLGLESGQLRVGHSIFTTIDENAQLIAQQTVRDFRNYLPDDHREKEGISSAIVAMDPATGAILAMSGGFNSFQGTPQPGSAFKPIAYAYALESQKYTLINNHFCTDIQGFDPEQPDYSPSDFGGRYHERELTMREAMMVSCNIYAVLTNQHLGPQNIKDFAYNLGYEGDLQAGSSMVLGTNGVTMPNMASIYSIFANGGYRVEPYIIEEIRDRNGNVVYTRPPQVNERVISEETAFLVTDMMRDVLRVPGGTAYSASYRIPNRDTAVKTGTTSDYAYMAGYTPEMVSIAYVGYDFPKGDLNITGASISALWADFTNKSLDLMLGKGAGGSFDVPGGVTEKILCSDTHLLATANCPSTFTEYFIEGTGPETYCNLHQNVDRVVDICTDSWKKATHNCPTNSVRSFIYPPGQEIPTEDCDIHNTFRWPWQ